MYIKLKGVVLRRTPISDNDAYLTVFTGEKGTISALARGIGRQKSMLGASAQNLSFGELTLYQSKDKYIVNAIDLIEPFVELRSDLSGLSLAAYMGDAASRFFDEGTDSGQALRLFLNCLHLLCTKTLPEWQIKAIFELRICALAGFMPDLTACQGCGNGETELQFFDIENGTLRCADCGGMGFPLSPSVLAAMRHIVYAKMEKLFFFTLSPPSDAELSAVCEQYLLSKAEKSFKTLDFYRSVSFHEYV